jgi:hypothetical protein
MTTQLKIKSLKNVFQPGTAVPVDKDIDVGNKVGIFLENKLEKHGFPVNRGKGPDLSGMEIKSRKRGTTSAITFGSMTTEDIINTPWDDCAIKKKIERMSIVNWDPDLAEIIGTDLLDTTGDACQTILRDAYEKARAAIIAGEDTYTKNTGGIYLERKSGNTWQMRASTNGLRRIIDCVTGQPVLNDKELFPDA